MNAPALVALALLTVPAAPVNETIAKLQSRFDFEFEYFFLTAVGTTVTARVECGPECQSSPVELLDLALEGTGLRAIWNKPMPDRTWSVVISEGPAVRYCYPSMPADWAPMPPCRQRVE